MRKRRGFTTIELVTILAISAILASALVGVAAPQIQLFFFMPQRLKMQNAAADLSDILLSGDGKGRGIRFAEPVSVVVPGGSSAVSVDTATPTTFAFTYVDFSQTSTPANPIRVVYQYLDPGVTRRIDTGSFSADGSLVWSTGTPQVVPYYATAASDVKIRSFENNNLGQSAFFRYYDTTNNEFVPLSTEYGNIRRVDIAFTAGSQAADSSDSIRMKTGVEIKDFSG